MLVWKMSINYIKKKNPYKLNIQYRKLKKSLISADNQYDTQKKPPPVHRKPLIKGGQVSTAFCIYNTDTKHYEQTRKLDRKSTIIFKRNISICSNVTNFYKQSGPCFYHPLFSKDSQERLTYILVKNILPWMCRQFWWYVFLKWHFSGRTIHAHNVWYACHSLATNATCLLFVTAQDTYSFK